MLKKARVLAILFAFMLLLSSCDTFLISDSDSKIPSKLPSDFRTLGEIWNLVDKNYVDSSAVDPERLSQGAINGMLDALGDPHTVYFDAESYEIDIDNLFEGEYNGIGATVGIKDDQIVIIAPLADSPAEKAGILPGDIILEVNGESTSGMTLNEAVLKIRGPEGEKVRLLVLHEGAEEPVEIEIGRAVIHTMSVSSEVLEDNIGYLKISTFAQNTSEEVEEALDDLLEKGTTRIIIDVRDNPGGLLKTVVDVAGQFIDGGVILYEVNRDGEREEVTAKRGGKAIDMPLVVLVNENSASGSEVLAGAIQDRERGPIVGTTTFGKGSVNVLYELSDGSALYLTIERWLTPDGRPIEGKGLDPDYIVEITSDDIEKGEDPQLQKALDYLLEKQTAINIETFELSQTI